MSCFAWNNANLGNKLLHRRILESAGALAIMTTLTGVLYLVDFFYVIYQVSVLLNFFFVGADTPDKSVEVVVLGLGKPFQGSG